MLLTAIDSLGTMEIKIKDLRLDSALLIPTGILLIGFFSLGRYLRILEVGQGFRAVWLAVALICLSSIWTLPINLGGLVGGLILVGISFWQFGLVSGLITLVAAIAYLVIALDDIKPQAQVLTLKPYEWLAVLVIIGLALGIGLGIAHTFSGWLGGFTLGICGGAIATIGFQIQQSELKYRQIALTTGISVLISLGLGLLQASLTYFPTAAT
ncbi:MAG: hypothetical protein SFT94_12725 [Pseudanabaenaceae cyanobacterium bins.68]|nr:hypothetical protein [Pseudanabaenaceae cyanobacterium bins.68]